MEGEEAKRLLFLRPFAFLFFEKSLFALHEFIFPAHNITICDSFGVFSRHPCRYLSYCHNYPYNLIYISCSVIFGFFAAILQKHLAYRGNATVEFKDRLKLLRKEKRLTQVNLAKMLNYGYTAIANYESGRNQPSIPDLKKIASIFNVSMDYLLGVNDIRHPYVIDDDTAQFNEFRRFYARLNEESKSELLLYMQWLVEREDKMRSVVYYESRMVKNADKRVAQEPEEYHSPVSAPDGDGAKGHVDDAE